MTDGVFARVLVAIDGSLEGAMAIEKAIRMAADGGTHVDVVAVLEPPFIDAAEAGPVEIAREYQAQHTHLRHHLYRARERLKAAGIETTPELLHGSAKATIVERAKELGVDLVVMGGPHHALWECGLRGCTACWVARHAPCSVMVVRDGQSISPGVPTKGDS